MPRCRPTRESDGRVTPREMIQAKIDEACRLAAEGKLEDATRALQEAERLVDEHNTGHMLLANAMSGVGEAIAMMRALRGAVT